MIEVRVFNVQLKRTSIFPAVCWDLRQDSVWLEPSYNSLTEARTQAHKHTHTSTQERWDRWGKIFSSLELPSGLASHFPVSHISFSEFKSPILCCFQQYGLIVVGSGVESRLGLVGLILDKNLKVFYVSHKLPPRRLIVLHLHLDFKVGLLDCLHLWLLS